MSGAILIGVSYLFLAVFVVAFVARSLKIARMPVHLRWELSPVPHEKGKGHYGGSYLEEPEWWSKPREKDHAAEVTYMVKEIMFLKALFEHNRRLWWFSFPFHFGLYLLSAMAGLVVIGGIAQLSGFAEVGLGMLGSVVAVLGGAGYALGAVGALGVFFSRLLDPKMRTIATPLTFFNLILLFAFFVTGGLAVFTLTGFPVAMSRFVGALLTVDTAVVVPGLLAAHLVLAGVFLAYLPFTPMMHFVAKYFTYHQVRWDDAPLEAGGKMEAEIQDLLKQPVSWAAPHLGADGTKNWVDIATSTSKKETGQ